MKPTDKCPDCNGDLVQVPDGIGTMYIADSLYCDFCDKYHYLDPEYQPSSKK